MEFLSYLITGISLGSIYAIIALGYTMVYGIAKMLNFAHGDVIMVGAYVSFYVTMFAGNSLLGDAPSALRITLPEIYLEKPDVEERIRKINEAYRVLGHPADKRRYDALYDQRRKTVARPSSAPPRREAPKGGHSAGNSRGKRDKHTRRIFLTTFFITLGVAGVGLLLLLAVTRLLG